MNKSDDDLSKDFINVSIHKDFYYNRELGFSTIIKEYEGVEKILIELNYISCITIQIEELGKVEYIYGSVVYNNLLSDLAKKFKELKAEKFRKEDIFIYSFYEIGTFILFFSPPREKKTQLLYHLKKLAKRIQSDIKKKLFDLFFPLIKKEVDPKIGHALVVNSPMIKNIRLISQLIKDSIAVGELISTRRKYSRKYMLQMLIIEQNIETVFQPIVSLDDLKIIGYEALSRGPKDTDYRNPAFLFSLAEECGLSFELDSLCRKKAFETIRNNMPEVKVFINTLAMTIHDPEFRGAYLKDLLNDLKLKPENVVFEISEKLAIENYDIFRKALKDYTDIGIVYADDDLGKDYSNLERIMELKPGYLKVDMVLVKGIDKNFIKQEIVKAVLLMAKGINSEVIAEGIETKEEYLMLKSLNVRLGQGYLFGRPSNSFQTEIKEI